MAQLKSSTAGTFWGDDLASAELIFVKATGAGFLTKDGSYVFVKGTGFTYSQDSAGDGHITGGLVHSVEHYNNKGILVSLTTDVGGKALVLNGTTATVNPALIAATVFSGNDVLNAQSHSGNDVLKGYAGNDKLYGGAGNDKLYGGTGNDSLSGGTGNDRLFGDAGIDKLLGGSGIDLLNGGVGNDMLTGGLGADTFQFTNSYSSTATVNSGHDTITDFTIGTDKLTSVGTIWASVIDTAEGLLVTGHIDGAPTSFAPTVLLAGVHGTYTIDDLTLL